MESKAFTEIDFVIPIKKHSSRLRDKNTKIFLEGKNLLQIKLQQIINGFPPEQIVVCSDSELAVNIAKSFNVRHHFIPNSSDNTWPNNINAMVKAVERKYMCIHRVTTPYIGTTQTVSFLQHFFSHVNEYDSAVSAIEIQSQLLDIHRQPMNFGIGYDHKNSQDTIPIYSEICGISIIDKNLAKDLHYHYGVNPLMYLFDPLYGCDINNEDDWKVAQTLSKIPEFYQTICLEQLAHR